MFYRLGVTQLTMLIQVLDIRFIDPAFRGRIEDFVKSLLNSYNLFPFFSGFLCICFFCILLIFGDFLLLPKMFPTRPSKAMILDC